MNEDTRPCEGPTYPTLVLGRGLFVACYALAFMVSVGDIFAPSVTLQVVAPRSVTVGAAVTLSVLSLVGLYATLVHRWRIEWVASSAIAFLLLERSARVWGYLFQGHPQSMSIAAMMTLGAFCLSQRALGLWAFDRHTRQSAEHHSDLR